MKIYKVLFFGFFTLLLLGKQEVFAVGAWDQVGLMNFGMNHYAISQYNSLAIDNNGTPYVAFVDGNSTDGGSDFQKVISKEFDGTNWVDAGSGIVSDGAAYFSSMAIDSSNVPYVSYVDLQSGTNSGIVVKKLIGSTWTLVGASYFGNGSDAKLVIDGTTPYVAYADANIAYPNQYAVTVKKYNGTSWATVGNAGMSGSSGSSNISIAINPISKQPWVLFSTLWNPSNALNVMSFDGANWTAQGGVNFATGYVVNQSLAFDQSGVPYITYQDSSNSDKIAVKKLQGGVWLSVGAAGISSATANSPEIAFSQQNIPYVLYLDNDPTLRVPGQLTMQSFQSGSWGLVGAQGFSYWLSSYPQMAFNPKTGDPYAFGTLSNLQVPTVFSYDPNGDGIAPAAPSGLGVQ